MSAVEPEFHLVKDLDAGFYRVSPTPDVETLRRLYQHEYYVRDKPSYLEKTARELGYWHGVWDMRLDGLARALGDGLHHILDVGASGGFFLARARERGWRIAGVEPSIQSVAYARENLEISLHDGYLEDMPEPAEPFDAIHMALVLEHVRDPRAFLTRALSLLRPGGVIWVETPNDFNPLQKVIVHRLEKPEWWIVPEHHLNYFDYDSLSALLTELGAKELDRVATFPMEFFPLMGIDYIGNDTLGAKAHGFRMNLEKHLLAEDPATLTDLYRALAKVNLGRTCNLIAQKSCG